MVSNELKSSTYLIWLYLDLGPLSCLFPITIPKLGVMSNKLALKEALRRYTYLSTPGRWRWLQEQWMLPFKTGCGCWIAATEEPNMDLNAILWLGTFRLLHSNIPLPPFLNWSKHCLFFIIFCLFNTVDSTYKLCRQLDSNRGCLVSKVTVLSTAPQPLSLLLPFPLTRITINGNGGRKNCTECSSVMEYIFRL